MTAFLMPAIPRVPSWTAAGVASVALRQIRPNDADALQDFVRALSPTSRRMRFHAALNELSESSLRALTCADQRGHVAFVLTTTEHGTERIVGEACYAVSSEAHTAEFGIAVADELRGQGLAERLLAALIDKARAAGLRWLVGEVMACNARMLAFIGRCGFAKTTRGCPEPGLVRVERSVASPLPVARAAGSWRAVARRRVQGLLAALAPSPRDAGSLFQTF
jgi:RimJ/RimL family protein N-acetyltransferase